MKVSIKKFILLRQKKKKSNCLIINEEFPSKPQRFQTSRNGTQRHYKPLTHAWNREETGYADGPWAGGYTNRYRKRRGANIPMEGNSSHSMDMLTQLPDETKIGFSFPDPCKKICMIYMHIEIQREKRKEKANFMV